MKSEIELPINKSVHHVQKSRCFRTTSKKDAHDRNELFSISIEEKFNLAKR